MCFRRSKGLRVAREKEKERGNLSGCCTHMPHATCRSELHTCLLCVRAVAARREEANNVNMWSSSGACCAPLELPLSPKSRMSRLGQDKAMLSLGFVSEIGFWTLCVQTKRRRFVSSLSAVTGTTNNTRTHTHIHMHTQQKQPPLCAANMHKICPSHKQVVFITPACTDPAPPIFHFPFATSFKDIYLWLLAY